MLCQSGILVGAAEARGKWHLLAERGSRRFGQARQHWCVEDARGNTNYSNTIAGQLARNWQGHAGDSRLGGGVGRLADLAIERRDRRSGDDHAALALVVWLVLGHARRREPDGVEGANQVDPNHALEARQLKRTLFAEHLLSRGYPGA